MESKALENLKNNLTKSKLLASLKVQLDASYNAYMTKEYVEKLKEWEKWPREERKPKPRPSAEFFIDKIEPYIDKLNLTTDADYVTRVEWTIYSEEKIKIIIHVLTKDGILIQLNSSNGEPPERIDYKVNYDISKVLLSNKEKTVWVYTKRKWDDPFPIRFETEDAAFSHFNKLNEYKNSRPGFRKPNR